jgi:hypothetical protein
MLEELYGFTIHSVISTCDEYLVKIHLPLVSEKTSVENQDWKGRRGKILLVVFLLNRQKWVLKFIGIFRFEIHYD